MIQARDDFQPRVVLMAVGSTAWPRLRGRKVGRHSTTEKIIYNCLPLTAGFIHLIVLSATCDVQGAVGLAR